MKLAIIVLTLFLLSSNALANCDADAPYYHSTRANSIGSNIADIFLLIFSIPVALLATPNDMTTKEAPSRAVCMPASLVKHLAHRTRPNPH